MNDAGACAFGFQQVSDHFAMGTKDVMFAYAEKPMPYTLACCEGYVARNLNLQCMARDQSVLEEEFGSAANVEEVSSEPTFVFARLIRDFESVPCVSGAS